MINRRRMLSGAVVGVAALWAVPLTVEPAFAESFKLTAIGGPPPLALSVKMTKEHFLPEVNKRLAASGSSHRIEWTEAWSGSVASLPEVFTAIENGVGDLGVQVWPFEGSKLPTENMTFHVPFGTSDPLQLVEIFASCVPGFRKWIRFFKSTIKSIWPVGHWIPTISHRECR